ncbi:MAG: bifunctional phosphoserine phosphatase/homoserine phosphotransferase ThrH [Burkholderiales bacterium]|nr:bifunctional phosphoserine phosphatase/homoserine phosphotransferase ThrH [Burkholderiales bacterium]
MHILCLDLEGVLIPEIWLEFSERTGIAELARTTRDEPDYDRLMRARLDILRRHKLGLADIQQVIERMGPLPGAQEFLGAMRSRFQVVILSDTFSQFAQPLMRQLGWPTLFCHELDIGPDGEVRDYRLRMADHKRAAVRAFKALNFRTIAAGDSYNDVAMLGEAHAGIFVHPPAHVAAQFPHFPVTRSFAELEATIVRAAEPA